MGDGDERIEEAFGLREFFNEVAKLTKIQLDSGDDHNIIYFHMMSEAGEVAEALAKENGSLTKAHKDLSETAKEEAVDVIQCALSLYVSLGGDITHLTEYGKKKNAKWEKAQKKCRNMEMVSLPKQGKSIEVTEEWEGIDPEEQLRPMDSADLKDYIIE